MSYGKDINTLFLADASLVAYCNGGIRYENLPKEFDLTKSWIAYSFRKNDQTDCLNSKNAYTTYQITAKIVAPDTNTMETISDHLVEYFNGNSQGDIVDIWFTSDDHQVDLEKRIYMDSLNFDSFYVG